MLAKTLFGTQTWTTDEGAEMDADQRWLTKCMKAATNSSNRLWEHETASLIARSRFLFRTYSGSIRPPRGAVLAATRTQRDVRIGIVSGLVLDSCKNASLSVMTRNQQAGWTGPR